MVMKSVSKKMQIILSIIVPVYNTPRKYLEDSLGVFRNFGDSRVELIVADDGSNSEIADYLDSIIFDIDAKSCILKIMVRMPRDMLL